MKKALLLALVPLLMATTCNKKEKQYPTYYMDQEFKDYTLFKVGSYWVYQDSATKQIDSVYLYKQTIAVSNYGKEIGYNAEYFSEELRSSLFDTLLGGGGKPLEKAGYSYGIIRLKDFLNSSTYYFTGHIGDEEPSNGNLKFIKTLDSLNFIEKFYSLKCFENNTEKFIYQPHKTYYAKHIGLVRSELFNGQVWNLIRYHVTQ
jgi:hypothetical protein